MKTLLSLFILLTFASFAQAQSLGSCKIFPSNNPWNQRIDSLPVHPNSSKFIATVGASVHVHPDFGSNAAYGIPWRAVGSSQTFVPITITSGWGEEDKGPMPIPENAPVEGGGVGDAHVLVVDTSDHHLYELYQGKKDQSGMGWSATTSAIFALDSNNYRPDGWTSCDAAGLPIWPGLVRKAECDAGEIKHAIRFTVQKTSKGWIFPARHHAGSTTDTTNVMPMGMRFRLKSSFDDSKFTGNAKVIATAMKRYGIIMADNGSNWFITGETNTSWDDDNISQLKAIVGSDFEAVYTGPIRTPSTYASFSDPVLPIPSDNTDPQISGPQLVRDTALAGTADTFKVRVGNTGGGNLMISLTKIKNGANFTLLSSPSPSLSHGEFDDAVIVFSPTSRGQVVDTLTIKSNDPVNSGFKVALIGYAQAGNLTITPKPDFGAVKLGIADTMRMKMTNTGDAALTINAMNPTGSNTDFTVIGVEPPKFPPITMQPNDSVVALIRFQPSSVGLESTSFHLLVSRYATDQLDTTFSISGEGVSSSGVRDHNSNSEISIYPNPSDGKLTIDVPQITEKLTIELADVTGRVVMQSREQTFDISSLPNGAYLVQVGSGAKRISRWITVQH